MNVKMRSLVLLTTAGLLLVLGSKSRSQDEDSPQTSWLSVQKALDTDEDGSVSAPELKDLKAAAELILKICNKDGDSGLSNAELVAAEEIRFQADTDENYYVTRMELDTWLIAWQKELSAASLLPPKRTSLKTILDTNNNGFKLSEVSNLVRASQTIMKALDADSDKKLSAAELALVEESLRDEDADGKGVNSRKLIVWLSKWKKQLAKEPAVVEPVKDPNAEAKTESLKILLDGNRNGLTKFDLANVVRSATRVMEHLDTDKDAILSKAETAAVIEDLDVADVDGNGVNRREVIDWLTEWRKKLD